MLLRFELFGGRIAALQKRGQWRRAVTVVGRSVAGSGIHDIVGPNGFNGRNTIVGRPYAVPTAGNLVLVLLQGTQGIGTSLDLHRTRGAANASVGRRRRRRIVQVENGVLVYSVVRVTHGASRLQGF